MKVTAFLVVSFVWSLAYRILLRQGLSYSGGFTAMSSNWCKNSSFQTKSSTSTIFKVKTCKKYWVCSRNPDLVLF